MPMQARDLLQKEKGFANAETRIRILLHVHDYTRILSSCSRSIFYMSTIHFSENVISFAETLVDMILTGDETLK